MENKKLIVLLCLLIAFNILFLNVKAQAPAGYSLVWSDEFTSASLDTSAWRYRVGNRGGVSYQREENVSLEAGNLKIDLKKENFGGRQFTGGGIITKTPRRYGYFEVNVKLSGEFGWHEAFWTNWMSGFEDESNPSYTRMGKLEIDVFEHYADHNNSYFTYGAIQWDPIRGSVNRDYQTVSQNLATSYNTFGVEITPDYINYFFNGAILKTIDAREVPQHDIFLWLTCIATDLEATESGAVYFDYLRCYEISPEDYDVRKVPFLSYLRGPQESSGTDLWIQAENFKQIGNWVEEMDEGAVVLKGHTTFSSGRDSLALTASTGIKVNTAGTYTLWVRSRDASTAPGTRKFKVLINGQESLVEFGTHGINGYTWENGGTFTIPQGESVVKLYDSSQFFARCDKLLLTTDASFVPSGYGGLSNVIHSTSYLGYEAFQQGNIVVSRIGDGSGALTIGTAQKVFLDEYTPAGVHVRTISMPVSAVGSNDAFTLPVSSTDQTEGFLVLSGNGEHLTIGGYGTAPGTAGVTASNTINRVIAIIGADGIVNTSTSLSSSTGNHNSFAGVAIRSAVTSNGNDIWVTGGNFGVRYTTKGASTSSAVGALTGRCLNIFNNQLYTSSTAAGIRIAKIGDGLPSTSGQSMTNLNGIISSSGSPYGFFMADLSASVAGLDALYVAEDGNNALSKYSLVDGAWVLTGRIGSNTDKYTGLTGKVTTEGVVLYATRKNAGSTSGGGEIVKILDASGYNGTLTATPTILITATTNTLIKGIAFAPSYETLPLEMGDLKAEMKDGYAFLEFNTQSEKNVDRIEIEKSQDGKKFVKIGYLLPKNEPGNHQYYFLDNQKVNNEFYTYYRLKIIDKNGALEHSKVSVLKNNLSHLTAKSLTIYPNPVEDFLHVEFPNDFINGSIEIRNIEGIKFREMKVKRGEVFSSYDVSDLQKGIYLLVFKNNNTVEVEKFIKL